jgi:hypothetical protein
MRIKLNFISSGEAIKRTSAAITFTYMIVKDEQLLCRSHSYNETLSISAYWLRSWCACCCDLVLNGGGGISTRCRASVRCRIRHSIRILHYQYDKNVLVVWPMLEYKIIQFRIIVFKQARVFNGYFRRLFS